MWLQVPICAWGKGKRKLISKTLPIQWYTHGESSILTIDVSQYFPINPSSHSQLSQVHLPWPLQISYIGNKIQQGVICQFCVLSCLHHWGEQWRQNRNTIGGLAWEAAKQLIISAKHPRAKVKNWGGYNPPSPPGSTALGGGQTSLVLLGPSDQWNVEGPVWGQNEIFNMASTMPCQWWFNMSIPQRKYTSYPMRENENKKRWRLIYLSFIICKHLPI